MKIINIFSVLAICVWVLGLSPGVSAQDFYFSGETVVPVIVSNKKITVQIDSSATFFDVGTFIGNHPCLSAASAPEQIGRGCITVPLQPTCTFAAAAPDLERDPYVLRALPVYITESDSAEFAVTDLVSVQFDETLAEDSCLNILSAYGLRFDDSCRYRHNYWWCALADTVSESPLHFGNNLHVLGETEWASATMFVETQFQSEPSDPYFVNQYYLKNTGQTGGTDDADIDADLAWEITTGGVRVAILDDGFVDHPDLPVPRLIPLWDIVGDLTTDWSWEMGDDDPSPGDSANHGMACAGIIGGSHNGIGVAGISPASAILGIKMSNDTGYVPKDPRIHANGLYLAYATGASVISNSWSMNRQSAITDIREAIRYVSDPCSRPGGGGRPGVIVVFAAGNHANKQFGQRLVPFPANLPDVIAVGATDKNNLRWDYSCYGDALDVMAPTGHDAIGGVPAGDVWTVDQAGDDGWNPWLTGVDDAGGDRDYTSKMGGTSASCAQVAGIAALVLSRRPDLQNGCAPYETMLEILTKSAVDLGDPGKDPLYGHGRANAYRALLSVIHGDASNDGAVDAVDLSIVVDMIFVGGHATLDDRTGDWNCDGFVDSIDLSLIIDEIFFGGLPAPICFEY